MTSLFRLGQTLRGKLGEYTITKQIQDTVWFATNHAKAQTVVIKGVKGHPRVANERDVLRRFQNRTPYIRPLIDEIEESSAPPTIVLKHLDDHLLSASAQRALNQREIRYVSKKVLEALSVLHDEGYVHTDIKPDNVFVDYGDTATKEAGDIRFSDVQLGDLGGTYSVDSKYAKEGTPIGAPIWTSPEVIMETPWNTATDIWSFGTMNIKIKITRAYAWWIISLIYGGNFNLFRPKTVPYGHEEYGLEVLKQQFRYFGPFPVKYEEVCSPETLTAILYLMREIPKSKTTPFRSTTEREVSKEDKEFIGRIMMMDWRDRPLARELFEDEWCKNNE